MTASLGSFFDWFGSQGPHGSKVHSKHLTNYPAYYNHSNTLSVFYFPESLKSCLQLLTTKPDDLLRLEHPKKEDEETDQHRITEPRTVGCECHRDSKRPHELWTAHQGSTGLVEFYEQ